ncbi:Uncharacterized protein FWK35_00021778 [Aphis craccivora]|uniref:Uncharacterized protein n=1 Tax=Aphis craccivora TaxID=307492 RepID=A0A6G0ZMS4_APHCR|nr:Uncharacterized protein FWK35_00021778 [Aphis craccivora]
MDDRASVTTYIFNLIPRSRNFLRIAIYKNRNYNNCVVSLSTNFHGFDLDKTACMKYAPTTSEDVRCSCSLYNHILTSALD